MLFSMACKKQIEPNVNVIICQYFGTNIFDRFFYLFQAWIYEENMNFPFYIYYGHVLHHLLYILNLKVFGKTVIFPFTYIMDTFCIICCIF